MATSAQITPFSFNTHAVRVIVRDGAPWFVASDVCAAPGYINSRKAVADHLDADEKGVTTGDTLGGSQKFTIISESGLYALVLRSRKPEARKFAKWVTAEVLPAIRKTGGYGAQQLPNVDQALAGANLIAARVQEAVFKQLLESGEWVHDRWMLSFNFSREGAVPHVHKIATDAMVVSMDKLAERITEPNGMLPSNTQLANLAKACNTRLAQRFTA